VNTFLSQKIGLRNVDSCFLTDDNQVLHLY